MMRFPLFPFPTPHRRRIETSSFSLGGGEWGWGEGSEEMHRTVCSFFPSKGYVRISKPELKQPPPPTGLDIWTQHLDRVLPGTRPTISMRHARIRARARLGERAFPSER